jgi:uncharacterized membrane protein YjfL (UPF0719 family)
MSPTALFSALVFAAIGILLFAGAFLLLGRALPGNLWSRAVEEGNLGAAIVLAGLALALGWIVASAVH